MSSDGETVAVGAEGESSDFTGIFYGDDPAQDDNTAPAADAVYLDLY